LLPFQLNGSTRYHLTFEENNMAYVDGFIVPVPKKKLKEYARIATIAG
jgi:hypothetical protein